MTHDGFNDAPISFGLGIKDGGARKPKTLRPYETLSAVRLFFAAIGLFDDLLEPLDAHAHARAAGAGGVVAPGLFHVGRAGDIQVQPLVFILFFDEVVQKQRRGDGAAVAGTADVAHVGDIAFEQLFEVAVERQRTRQLSGVGGGFGEAVFEGAVVTHQPRRVLAQRHDARTREGGVVEQIIRLHLSWA